MMSARICFVVALAFSLAFVSASQAGYLFDRQPGPRSSSYGLWTWTYATGSVTNAFSVNSPVKVTDLLDSGALFDDNLSIQLSLPQNSTATITESIQLIRVSDSAVLGAVTSPAYSPGNAFVPLSGSITPVVLQTGVDYALVTTFTLAPDPNYPPQALGWEYRPLIAYIAADPAVVSPPGTLYPANAIITQVPEPATLGMLGAGLLACLIRRRR